LAGCILSGFQKFFLLRKCGIGSFHKNSEAIWVRASKSSKNVVRVSGLHFFVGEPQKIQFAVLLISRRSQM
jgi:hypothetical protein